MMSDAVSRWARALTLPSVLFTTALAGHAVGDGAIPAASVLALLFVLTVVSVAPFTMVLSRRPAPPRCCSPGKDSCTRPCSYSAEPPSQPRPQCVARVRVRRLCHHRPAAT
jgi:hypothetical protein